MEKELHKAIQEDDDLTAMEILQDLSRRWFITGFILGVFITLLMNLSIILK